MIYYVLISNKALMKCCAKARNIGFDVKLFYLIARPIESAVNDNLSFFSLFLPIIATGELH